MINNLLKIHENLMNCNIKISNIKLNEVIQKYSFINISTKIEIDENSEIHQNLQESNIIIINYHEELNNTSTNSYFIFGFKNTILFTKQNSKDLIYNLLIINSKIKVCFIKGSKDIFDQNINIKYEEAPINKYLEDEIFNFNCNFNLYGPKSSLFNKTWNIIRSCITGYLIQNSYSKLNYDRINDYYQNVNKSQIYKIYEKDDYIQLLQIGEGSYFVIKLIYHIEDECLYVIKRAIALYEEVSKLSEREEKNYKKMHHPFIPKLYGTSKNDNFLIIEYISGQSLINIKRFNFNELEKINIIFQICSVFKYFHDNQFIYRDLKPDNIMIDENKNIVLIDFDRMIESNSKEEQTRDLTPDYLPPEINTGNMTCKSDIYSIGQIIYFIIKEKKPNIDISMNYKELNDYPEIQYIYLQCTKENPEERPFISKIFLQFSLFCIRKSIFLDPIDPYFQFILGFLCLEQNLEKVIKYYVILKEDKINIEFENGIINCTDMYSNENLYHAIHYFTLAANQNLPIAQFYLGLIYSNNKYDQFDINKALYYLTLASNQNYANAQNNLGSIYYFGIGIPKDIQKAIYYFTLASDQNNSNSQFNLGKIYYDGQYVTRNINKAIHYLTLASDQDHSEAQFLLGLIYLQNQFIPRDMNKVIHYFKLAADNNYTEAQLRLGLIYYLDQYVKPDINESIKYLKLASMNDKRAFFILGRIYNEGIYVQRDINVAINYFLIGSQQKDPKANNYLGKIYYEGKYVRRDVKKAVDFFMLASNQNCAESQYYIGLFYYNGIYFIQDINKAIHYLTLAADQNYSKAQSVLGKIYSDDYPSIHDTNKAIHYLKLAANQNNPDAQYNLAVLYYNNRYVYRDINKTIYYLELAANQNMINAQYELGLIYLQNLYIPRNIEKSIHFFSLASNQNHIEAQYQLGLLYYEGFYVIQDIQKSIYYFQLASNQNHSFAQFYLGLIYIDDRFGKKDISKTIYYWKLSANQNNPDALYNLGIIESDKNKALNYYLLASKNNSSKANKMLGVIYYYGLYTKKDISKAIKYFTLAANQDEPMAQCILGFIYYDNIHIKQNMKKSIYWLMRSSINNFNEANFALGYFYHEGKYMNQDIKQAIHFYKEASSFYNEHAKNNLGIIYKNGFLGEIGKNIIIAEIYFKEAILEKNDHLAMYNLSHIYIYEDKCIDESINLLIQSSIQDFSPAIELLCLVLIKKHNLNIENIKKELKSKTNNSNELFSVITKTIQDYNLYDQIMFELNYQKYREIDFVYDPLFNELTTNELMKHKISNEIKKKNNIDSEFYKGFGLDIYTLVSL